MHDDDGMLGESAQPRRAEQSSSGVPGYRILCRTGQPFLSVVNANNWAPDDFTTWLCRKLFNVVVCVGHVFVNNLYGNVCRKAIL